MPYLFCPVCRTPYPDKLERCPVCVPGKPRAGRNGKRLGPRHAVMLVLVLLLLGVYFSVLSLLPSLTMTGLE